MYVYYVADGTSHDQSIEQAAKVMSDAAQLLNEMGMGSLMPAPLNTAGDSGLF